MTRNVSKEEKTIRCLIDADLLLFEAGLAGQFKDEQTGEIVMLPFDNVVEAFDQKIKEIEDECWANEPSVLYFTGDEKFFRLVNRERKRRGEELVEFVPNFRFEKAKTTPYKNRKGERPLHYYNLRAYALSAYETKVSNGMEADDLLAMDHDKVGETTILCSRDKDLKQVPGMFYSWECGYQPAFGPKKIGELGELSLPKPTKLEGTGLKFFFSQVITGDRVDTIPGLPKGGPVLAYKTLKDCESEEEMYEKVSNLYKERVGEGWEDYLEEQLSLLWMVREVDEEGRPVLYRPPQRR